MARIRRTRLVLYRFRRRGEAGWRAPRARAPPDSRRHPRGGGQGACSAVRPLQRLGEPARATERALVVLMRPLDTERVRAFAKGKGVPNLDAFMAEVESGNLWRFARRPLDLDWLVQFWASHGRLGSLAEMLETSLTERLREPDRARRDPLER